jgi:DNA-binding NarL/FixJ family response regulator
LRGLIADEPDMVLVAEAEKRTRRDRAVPPASSGRDVMDLQMPEMDGFGALEAIRAQEPDARIVMLTTYPGDAQVVRALKAGACGYLLKSALRKELLSRSARSMPEGKRSRQRSPSRLPNMSVRNRFRRWKSACCRWSLDGNSNKEIAAKLGVSEEAVKGQVRHILGKLGANDRTQAAVLGLKRGIIIVV